MRPSATVDPSSHHHHVSHPPSSGTDSTTSPSNVFPDAPQNLSQSINASTKDLHDRVNFAIMDRFKLLLDANDHRLYTQGLRSFHPVYAAFESSFSLLLSRSSSLPSHVATALEALRDTRLPRAPAFTADLNYLTQNNFDPAAEVDGNVRPQVRAYVAHIKQRMSEKPHVALAYAHSYYMALFAGGKVLRRLLVNKKGFFPVHLPAGDEDEARKMATGMFEFPTEGDPEEIRVRFKKGMEVAEEGLSEEEKTDIIEEAREIFKWNEKLVHELDRICAPMYIKSKIEEPVKQVVQVVKRCPLRLPQEKFRLPIAMVLLILLWLVKRFYWQ